jgi:putative multiple sugar transport system permease protein
MSQTTTTASATPASGGATLSTRSLLDHAKHNLREYGMLITLVAIMGFFQAR